MSENTATAATTATASLSPTPPSPSALSLSTDLSLTAERLLRRPDRLERLYKKHLKSLEGNLCADLIVELSERTLDRGAFSAGVIKRIVEGLTTKELQEMGVERATLQERVGLKEGLIPLAELNTGVSRRCQNSLRRLDKTWGEDWQDKLDPIMPRYPAETFLRRLAIFAESNELDWSEAFLRDQIEARKN